MSRKTARIYVTLFFLLCVAIIVSINLVPRGNFIGAPFITLYIYTPLMVLQLFLLVQVWVVEKVAQRALKLSFYASLIITLVFIYLLYDYLSGTT